MEGGIGWWFDVDSREVFHATDLPLRKIADRLPNRDSPKFAKKIGKTGDDFRVSTFGGPGQGLYVVLSESYFCSDAIPKRGLHQDYEWRDAATLKSMGKPVKLHVIVSGGERRTEGKCRKCLVTRPAYKLFAPKDTPEAAEDSEERICDLCRPRGSTVVVNFKKERP